MKGKCFREPLFHEVVNGQITQFREIIPEKIMDKYYDYDDWVSSVGKPEGIPNYRFYESEFLEPYSRFKAGETVYLKEPYGVIDDVVFYKHVKKDISGLKEWESITMPEKYARYHIEITGVKAERLQDISDEDCLKEGIFEDPFNHEGGHIDYCNGLVIKGGIASFRSCRKAYAALIDAIHGKGAWESNPFVFVYDFKLKSKILN